MKMRQDRTVVLIAHYRYRIWSSVTVLSCRAIWELPREEVWTLRQGQLLLEQKALALKEMQLNRKHLGRTLSDRSESFSV
jgi:hypothetical protein